MILQIQSIPFGTNSPLLKAGTSLFARSPPWLTGRCYQPYLPDASQHLYSIARMDKYVLAYLVLTTACAPNAVYPPEIILTSNNLRVGKSPYLASSQPRAHDWGQQSSNEDCSSFIRLLRATRHASRASGVLIVAYRLPLPSISTCSALYPWPKKGRQGGRKATPWAST